MAESREGDGPTALQAAWGCVVFIVSWALLALAVSLLVNFDARLRRLEDALHLPHPSAWETLK